MEHIRSVSGTGSSATLSLTSIPNTYNSLVLKGVGHTTNTSQTAVSIRFNSDSNSNYDYNRGGRMGVNADADALENQTSGLCGFVPDAGNNVGTMLMQLDMNIWSYQKATTRPGRVSYMCQGNYAFSTSAQVNFLYSGWFDGSGPGTADDVTSIQLIMATGNWGSNTKFHLYGRVDS